MEMEIHQWTGENFGPHKVSPRISNNNGNAVVIQSRESFGFKPGFVPGFQGEFSTLPAWIEWMQKCFCNMRVEPQAGRKLYQIRTESIAEWFEYIQKSFKWIGNVDQVFPMGDESIYLGAKSKCMGCSPFPTFDRFYPWYMIETCVQLHTVELGFIVLEICSGLHIFGIEYTCPVSVTPTLRSYM